MLKMIGLDPSRMTRSQIDRAVKAVVAITREPCGDPRAEERRPAAIQALRKLIDEVPMRSELTRSARRVVLSLMRR
jgi:hypothetical protein